MLGYLYVSRKGISEVELLELIEGLTENQMQRFLSVFGFLLVRDKDYMFIQHNSFRKAIKETIDIVQNDDKAMILSRNLSAVIEKE